MGGGLQQGHGLPFWTAPCGPGLTGYTAHVSDSAEDLAAGMLAPALDVPFDLDRDYLERREQYRVGGHIVDTTSIAISAVGDEQGRWTTVITAAVLL